jgi:hypothetical protein
MHDALRLKNPITQIAFIISRFVHNNSKQFEFSRYLLLKT